ncbi:hypothetical protein J7M22_03145 [Candidatus Poribacteria bacterium]|nr:hypothetical protein [Candidatus Poribacteria bacterium]
MTRSAVTIMVSLPSEEKREEGRARSELVREALRRYFEEQEWSPAVEKIRQM